MYAAEDNLGTSYYFRGAVTNNYVTFAGFYWRIIRINGDGSIRIIYDGTSAHANEESNADRGTGGSAYNQDYNRSYYVGYTWTSVQRPSTQNGGTTSIIKGVLDNWYAANISEKGLDSKVVSSPGFCNDRNTASGYNWSASSLLTYAAYERLILNKAPTLECSNNNDLYTTKVGLITADEVMLAGGVEGTNNTSYYLYTGGSYWTMTPCSFDSFGYSGMFFVTWDGELDLYYVHNSNGVRPVINLSSDVTISSGDGTMNSPYIIS